MSRLSLAGLSGNMTSLSKTRALVRPALGLATARIEADPLLLDLAHPGGDLGRARRLADLSADAQQKVAALLGADALIVASPIRKAWYTGLINPLIDLIDPAALKRKPIQIATTGGGEQHVRAVEHQVRPLKSLHTEVQNARNAGPGRVGNWARSTFQDPVQYNDGFRSNLIGRPEQVAERIQGLKQAGADLMLLGVLHFQKEVAFFGKHVIPLVRKLKAGRAREAVAAE